MMRALELFAGAGGLALGMEAAGFSAAAVVERHPRCCATLRANRAWRVVEADARGIGYGDLAAGAALVSGGPPCQPFSSGGLRRGPLDERDMFPEAVRAVREIRPEAFVFENVKGLLRPGFAGYLDYVIAALENPGCPPDAGESPADHRARLAGDGTGGLRYRVRATLVNAADYGVPQARERLFLVGFRADLDVDWRFPAPTHSRDALLWDQWRSGDYWRRHGLDGKDGAVDLKWRVAAEALSAEPATLPWRTVRDALRGLGEPPAGPDVGDPLHRLQPGAKAYPGHTGSPLDWPAKALKAGVHGVPGGENMLVRGDGTVRYFTVREAARLQTFPDGYALPGTWSEAMRQLGNAVPVDLAAAVGRAVMDHLRTARSRKARRA